MKRFVNKRARACSAALAALSLLACGLARAQQPPKSSDARAPAPRISAAQADKLFRSVDTILHFDSQDTGLAIHHPVQRRLISRAQVMAYLRQQMADDKDTARLQRSALVLEKFGLLPQHFDLGGFLVRLLGEQVAGYYDAKTKTVNLLDWVDADEQKPVLAHELCHALQDQFQSERGIGLDKWENAGPDEPSTTFAQDKEHIRYDETDTAREAVLEGQAMVTYVDWGLDGQGQTLRTLPMIQADALSAAASKDPQSPLLDSAPLVLRESLLFPYQDGLIFEQYLLQHGGDKLAFSKTLERPPDSSWEILNPDAYLRGERAPLFAMANLHPLLDVDWAPYDIGVMGELDVRMLGEVLGDVGAGADFAKAWDGGVYYAAQRRDAVKQQGAGTGSIGLVYLSRWRSEAAAQQFAAVYRTSLPKRYPGLVPLTASQARTVSETGEGPVLVEQQGLYVFVSHTFPVPLAERVMQTLIAAQGADNNSGRAREDLSAPLRRVLASAGTLRSAAILSEAARAEEHPVQE